MKETHDTQKTNATLKALPKGFRASNAQAGFKTKGRPDLGLLLSDRPCVYAGLFTQNRFCAAPVTECRAILATKQPVRAVIANSGQANACTGDEGSANVHVTQEKIAHLVHIAKNEVLPLSTGVIGAQINMEALSRALPELEKNLGAVDAEGFTRAFMTTDAFPKYICEDITLSGGTVRVSIMAKGAGMICPNMATMLCVCLTDAAIDQTLWQDVFIRAADASFNRICVDGDTSTNDSIIGLANGASGISVSGEDARLLEEKLTESLQKVSFMLVQDGEGAKRVLRISVHGAISQTDAEKVARSVGNSQLVKTAVYGGDANWGRIITAVGYCDASYATEDVVLTFCGIERFRAGQPVNDDMEEELSKRLQDKVVDIDISLGSGPAAFTLYASDLGHEYVSLNADYRS